MMTYSELKFRMITLEAVLNMGFFGERRLEALRRLLRIIQARDEWKGCGGLGRDLGGRIR